MARNRKSRKPKVNHKNRLKNLKRIAENIQVLKRIATT
jgi:hypothetical protein